MILKVDGKYSDQFLKLGIQTNKGKVGKLSKWVAKQWAPKNCKSLTILKLIHTDYHGVRQEKETGYATINVQYYSTVKEGKINIKDIPESYP